MVNGVLYTFTNLSLHVHKKNIATLWKFFVCCEITFNF